MKIEGIRNVCNALKRRGWLVILLLLDIVMCFSLYIQTGEAERVSNPLPVQEGAKVALTFDDGPHPIYTEQLLDGLRKRGVHATFFITGKNAELYPDLVKREQEEGHLIGNHTYSHLQLTKGNREQFKKELQQTNVIIEGLTGQNPGFVRPPYGAWDKSFEGELHMVPVLWTIDPLDWCKSDADCVTRSVLSKVKDGSIILMHDEYPSTVEAALRIVDALQKQGYVFVTVEELLFD